MPETPPTVTSAEQFIEETGRLLGEAYNGLDASDRARVTEALRRASAYAQQLVALPADHPSYGYLRDNLNAERGTILSALAADKLRDANALVRGVVSAAVDLLIASILKIP